MRQKINFAIDVGMLIAFLGCGATGILKMSELNIPLDLNLYSALSVFHDWSGIVGIALAAAHVALHARWLGGMTRSVVGRRDSPRLARERTGKRGLRAGGMAGAGVLTVALLFAQSSAPAWAGGHARFSNATIPQGIDYPAGSLKDGTYTGTANGYMPSLTVEVTVKGGKITAVNVVSHGETMRWYVAVKDAIPERILKEQSTDVDSVSGATCSSNGILSAVENALAKAAK